MAAAYIGVSVKVGARETKEIVVNEANPAEARIEAEEAKEVTHAIRVNATQMVPLLRCVLSTGFTGNQLTGARSQLPVHGGTITYLNRTINEIQQDSTIKMTQKKFRDYFMAMVLKKFKK